MTESLDFFAINYDILIKLYAIDSEKYFSKSAKKYRGGKNHPLCDRMRIYLRLFLLAIITRRRKVRNVLSAATTYVIAAARSTFFAACSSLPYDM